LAENLVQWKKKKRNKSGRSAVDGGSRTTRLKEKLINLGKKRGEGELKEV